MKLAEPQITQLYTFTQKHYVDWYDVQTELVDHLANGIEEHLEQNPNTSFESALNSEFKKFGVMGFNDVIEEKTKALNKRYWRLIWFFFKDYLKPPKIVLTLGLIWVYFQTLQFAQTFHINWILIPTLTVLFGLPWCFLIQEFKRSKKIKKETGQKWLFDHTISQLGGLVHFMNFAIYFQVIYQSNGHLSLVLSTVFSALVILFGLLLYISIFIVAPKLRKAMAKQHPEYKFV